mgnify:CR=1 FL=1
MYNEIGTCTEIVLKPSLVEIAPADERMILPVEPNFEDFEKDQINNAYINHS